MGGERRGFPGKNEDGKDRGRDDGCSVGKQRMSIKSPKLSSFLYSFFLPPPYILFLPSLFSFSFSLSLSPSVFLSVGLPLSEIKENIYGP